MFGSLRVLSLVAIAFGPLMAATPVFADMGYCNRSNEQLSISIWTTIRSGGLARWHVSGWWVIDPGQCVRTYRGDPRGSGHAFYAERYNRGRWIAMFEVDRRDPEPFDLCVDPSGNEFVYTGVETQRCRRGAVLKRFIEVNPHSSDYWVDLRLDSYFR